MPANVPACLACVCLAAVLAVDLPAQTGQTRPAQTEAELQQWLLNMQYHHFQPEEMQEVTGLAATDLQQRLAQFGISAASLPPRPQQRLFVLPYPGGRHPRIGFLDGAINPQRETKLSVFCPWDESSYAVLDIPEAIWSNLGLTYLAHTHIDTIWSAQNIALEQKEWTVSADGNYELVRRLPNGIEFGVKVQPLRDHLRMKMWLTNGSDQPLSDLRVQNCVMLKAIEGFEQQTNDNKRFEDGYAVAGSADASRWIISAWDPPHRTWGNAPCPCLHSDPKFADCAPGETQWLRGWFSFYEGTDISGELQRIENTGWRKHPLHHVTGNLIGKATDAATGKLLPCRLYVQHVDDGSWHFARSTAVAGSAVVYDKQLGKTASIERHTSLSADGFQLDVPPGSYRVRAELGKEYLADEQIIEVGDQRTQVELKLRRVANMAELGWFSGDTHVHRSLAELPTAMLAEDLNVALPLTYWVRDSREIPASSGPEMPAEPHYIDPQHVLYPINTEYEIFTVDGKRHTQGAVFILNHQTPLRLTAPPVLPLAAEARRQGGLLDLDKHSWNWSLMVIPRMKVDLFELSNNHHWRTQFGFPQWTLDNAPPSWPEVERDAQGFTEKGWTEFGLQTYYALLNCGFRMRVTAGTASGVHPVPLGHGRVYVHTGQQFDYASWMEHLNAGHSFVTQGPLMDIRFNGELPGTTWHQPPPDGQVHVRGTIVSRQPLARVELIKNGELIASLTSGSMPQPTGGFAFPLDVSAAIEGTSWVALRCFERAADDAPAGKVIFAHTNPVFVDVPDRPLHPRQRDVSYFIERMDAELDRNRDVLSEQALQEYREAKSIYEAIERTAVD